LGPYRAAADVTGCLAESPKQVVCHRNGMAGEASRRVRPRRMGDATAAPGIGADATFAGIHGPPRPPTARRAASLAWQGPPPAPEIGAG